MLQNNYLYILLKRNCFICFSGPVISPRQFLSFIFRISRLWRKKVDFKKKDFDTILGIFFLNYFFLIVMSVQIAKSHLDRHPSSTEYFGLIFTKFRWQIMTRDIIIILFFDNTNIFFLFFFIFEKCAVQLLLLTSMLKKDNSCEMYL